MSRQPRRRSQTPARQPAPTPQSDAGGPVEVRLIGHDPTVRRLVAALQDAAGTAAGPVRYRPCRDGDGIRAYLTVAVPPDPT